MKTTYEILIWMGSQCPNIGLRYFDLHEAQKALETYKNHVSIAKEYHKSVPQDDGLPYMTIKRWNRFGEFVCEYGLGCDVNFSELPKYVQKKCSALIEYDLSDK
tara:strand:+ start:2046 stop:2357 length:312 start_codon:yes stop_codon:yes gene_type:complete